MARKPKEFEEHPTSFTEAQDDGLVRGICLHVTDGDTADFLLDLGWLQYAYETVRLRGIDTPEIYRPENDEELAAGQEAKGFVESLVLDQPVLIRSYKDKTTFGRFVADVWYYTDGGNTRGLADRLREEGYDWSDR